MTDEEVEMYGRMFQALKLIQNCEAFAPLIPEVRTSFVYTKEKAESPKDVLAVEGRITVVAGRPHPSGPLAFGASSHMARFLIGLRKVRPSIRAGINFAHNPSLSGFLERYCKQRGWTFIGIDRSKEPEEIKEEEGASVPWKAREVLELAGNRIPKIVYETGAIGKEPVSAILGEGPIELAREMCELANAYKSEISPPPRIGKVPGILLSYITDQRTGASNPSILVPPKAGVDSGVIDIGNNKVLIIAEDPIFTLPGLPLDFFGWVTVHIGASDVAVMGVRPQFMTYTLLMPPGMPDEDFKRIIDSIHTAAKDLGIAIVGGHTGYYPGILSPTIGGITVFSIVDKGSYITPMGARPGDDVLMTKGPAIEASGALALISKEKLLKDHRPELVDKALALAEQMSVVKDAEIAMEVGGVTAMHDATEGGVVGGLFEIANASNVGIEVDEEKFPFPEEVEMVCSAFGIDPISSISEGTLLLTSKPSHSKAIVAKLAEAGIPSSIIGSITGQVTRRIVKRKDGRIENISEPSHDPFWPVFFKALGELSG